MWGSDSASAGPGRKFGAGRGFKPPAEAECPGRSNGFGTQDGGSEGYGNGGFNGGGGFGRRGEDGGDGYGGRSGGGGYGGSGGGGGGGYRNDNDGGYGGGRSRRDDNGGGFGNRRRDDDGGGGGGYGGGGDGGGFGGRGRRNEDGGDGGFGGRGRRNEDGGGGGGFGGRGRRDEDGGGGGGFGGRGRRDEDGGGGGGFGGRGRRDEDGGGGGGFGGRGRRDEDGGGGGGGFGGRGRRDDEGGDGDRRGGARGGGDAEGEQKPRSVYVPPEPSEDEAVLFSTAISSGINFDRYESIEVKMTGENPPRPINRFEEAGLRELVLDNVRKSGYVKPTPVQKYALPIVMSGRDLMACAQTGSGKTAGFLLPIINTILSKQCAPVTDSAHTEPIAVIVAPTRELAQQIFNEARKFAHGSTCTVCIAYGGTACYAQAQKVARGCHILVATPGRLLDFVNRGRITFSSVQFVVLDEGDRMLDMGFLPDMEKMLDHPTMTPMSDRQTLLFSATFPREIQELAHRFLTNYIFLAVGIVGGACADVQQIFYEVSKFDKRPKLEEVLRTDESDKVLVFVETKRNVDFIAAYLSGKGIPATTIHGDREQREREEALRDFKSGKMRILVSTGVCARGLDIKNVGHVVNFDLPKSIDEYVHRIGRTGRVGNKGKATSFYDPGEDSSLADGLVSLLAAAQQEVPECLKQAASGLGGDDFRQGGFGGRDIRRNQTQHSSNAVEQEDAWD